MTKSLDEVARIWAARRLKLPVERVVEVHFEASDGYYYSELTNEDAHAVAHVKITGYGRSPRTRYKELKLLDDFTIVLNELVEIAQEKC